MPTASITKPGVQKPHWSACCSLKACLHRVQALRVRLGQTLDRPELVPLRLGGEDDAGADGLAVEQDRARPAHSVLAAEVRPRQARVPQGIGQRPVRGRVQSRLLAVQAAAHGQGDGRVHARVLPGAGGMSLGSPSVADYIFTMIRASKFYGADRKVLDDITLAFLPGAKIGVLGPNGAGKSTLLRIMAGREETVVRAAPSSRRARPSGCSSRSRSSIRRRTCAGTSRTASAGCVTC